MSGLPVAIIFHGIGTPGRELEPGEAPYWVSEVLFKFVLDQVVALPDPGRVQITFDDGNTSDHDIALPALLARGLDAQFFVLAGRIGQPGSLDMARIMALRAAGMRIGSHGIAHRDWTSLNQVELDEELRVSRRKIEDYCECPVTEAGIPFGRYDARVLRHLRASGYTKAWSSDGGTLGSGGFLRPRTSLRGDMSPAEIQLILDGRLPPLRRLRRALGMLKRRMV